MSKLIIAVPNQSMYDQAREVLTEEQMQADVLITSSQSVVADVRAVQAGQDAVVIARGYHAYLLRHQTDIPLVDIVLSGQEIALLAQRAVGLCKKTNPQIAFIGFHSMFSDPAPFAQMLHADLRVYLAHDPSSIPETVDMALSEGADVIVGGELALEHARRQGAVSLFLSSTKESLIMALRTARRVQYGMSMEKNRTQEFSALFDHSFDAILKLDRAGCVLLANSMAEKAFRLPAHLLVDRPLTDLLDLGPGDALSTAISERRDVYAAVVRTKGEDYVANLAVLHAEEGTEGFLLSLQAFKQIDELVRLFAPIVSHEDTLLTPRLTIS